MKVKPVPGAIPCRTYLKKYVLFRENLSEGEPLDLSQRGTIPRMLGALLCGKLNHDYQRDAYEVTPTHFPDQLEFKIDWWRSKENKIIITMESVRFFDSFLYDDFHDYLLTRIIEGMRAGGKEKFIIEDVMQELDIIDDISFDALKKASFRLRNARKIPHFRHQNSIAI